MNTEKTCAVILAAGSGKRMNLPITKQRISVLGKTVLERTLSSFDSCEAIDYIIVVCREDEMDFVRSLTKTFSKIVALTPGGAVRAESAFNGFRLIPSDASYVAIHDAARCLITPEMISKVVLDAKTYGAATAATYLTDTVKCIDNSGFAQSTVDRTHTVTVQTPQIFKVDLYKRALDGIKKLDSSITDDNMLVERIGAKIYCTDIGRENIKITFTSDVDYAEYILKRRGANV